MNNKLKPCPFCGSVYLSVLDYESRYRVECKFCKTRTGICDSEAEAIKAWNSRVEPMFSPDEIDEIRRVFDISIHQIPISYYTKIRESIVEKCAKALKGGKE